MKIVITYFLALLCHSQTIEMFGNTTLGYYYVDVYLGENAEPQSLIFDTGSDKTLTDCSGCLSCGKHIHPYHNPISIHQSKMPSGFQSFACMDDGCRFDQSYSEGSAYRGKFVLDVFRFLPNGKPFETIIGCINQETGLFVTQEADGIMGAGPLIYQRGGVNLNPPTPIDSAVLQGVIPNSKISICLAADGGKLSIGDMNWAMHLPGKPIQSIKTNERLWRDQYKLNLHNIFVGDKIVEYSFEVLNDWDQQGFFDTGTTFVYFPVEMYDKISDAFQIFCQERNDNCGNYPRLQNCFRNGWMSNQSDEEFLASFPVLKFKFDSPNLYTWKPQDYMVKSGNYDFCITFAPGDSLVYGASLFKNHDVLLDKENFEIKFVEANCAGVAQKYRHLSLQSNGYNNYFNEMINQYHSSMSLWSNLQNQMSFARFSIIAPCVFILTFIIYTLRKKREDPYTYGELQEINQW